MADDNKQSGTVSPDQDPEAEKISDRVKQPNKFSPIGGKPLVVRFGESFLGGKALITNVSSGGESAVRGTLKLKADSEIVVTGRGLSNLDYWELERTARARLDFTKVRAASDSQVVLNISDVIGGSLEEGERFGLGFFSSKLGGRMLALSAVFVFSEKEKEEDNDESKKSQDQDQEGKKSETGQDKKAPDVIGEFINSAIGGAPEAFGRGFKGAKQPAQNNPSPGDSISSTSQTVRQEGLDLSGGSNEVNRLQQKSTYQVSSGESVKQSFELVGKYIDDNPEVISSSSVRAEVSSALSGGSLESLSQEGRSVLQKVTASVSAEESSAVSGELKAAFKTVGQQVSSAGQKVSGSAVTTSTETESSISGGAGGGEGASVSVNAQDSVTAKTEFDLKQSFQIIHDHLSQNPGLIPKTETRGEVVDALSTGNMESLSPEAKGDLQKVLQTLGQGESGQPARVTESARNLGSNLGTAPTQASNEKQTSPGVSALDRTRGKTGQAQAQTQQPGAAPVASAGASNAAVKAKKQSASQIQQSTEVEVEKPSATSPEIEPTEPKLDSPTADSKNQQENLGPASEKGQDGSVPKVPGRPVDGLKPAQNIDSKKSDGDAKKAEQERLQKPRQQIPNLAEPLNLSKRPAGKLERAARKAVLAGALALSARDGSDLAGGQRPQGPQAKIEALKPQDQARPPLSPSGAKKPGQKKGKQKKEKPDDVEKDQSVQEQPGRQGADEKKQSSLTEAKKLDEVVKPINKAVNAFLMQGVGWVWGLGLETFGLSVVAGALLGDVLWIFKDSLIKFVIRKMPGTHNISYLDEKTWQLTIFTEEEIAEKIKISLKVKANIVAFNAIIAGAIAGLVLIFFLIIAIGCNYPPYLNKVSYKLTVVGLYIGDDCKYFDMSEMIGDTSSPPSTPSAVVPRP